ncbi:hypothetical protein pb186bvf_019746 [Paramecium bursaria]
MNQINFKLGVDIQIFFIYYIITSSFIQNLVNRLTKQTILGIILIYFQHLSIIRRYLKVTDKYKNDTFQQILNILTITKQDQKELTCDHQLEIFQMEIIINE